MAWARLLEKWLRHPRTQRPTQDRTLGHYGWGMATNSELREFLRTRRARVQPEDVGLEISGQRRVPGLRREEVAMLAGVSVDYYARLEQGRDLQPSDQVLDAIARGLRLAEVERMHLRNLVRSTVAVPEPDDLVLEPLDAGMRLTLNSLEIPALIIDLRGNIHAMNRIGRAMFVGLEPMPSAESSHHRWLFLQPATRRLLADWEMVARSSVGVLREAAGRYPRDTALHTLIGELTVASPEFSNWWAEHEVDTRCRGPKRFNHPVVGEIVTHIETLQLQDGARWLYVYAVQPGSPSEKAIRLLGSWAATEDAEEIAEHTNARPAPQHQSSVLDPGPLR
jgi:transcriptional regulator with XRE-family HTH domain